MSVDLSSQNAVVHEKQQQINKSLVSRKRKLRELFEVTVNRGIHDAPPSPPADAPSLTDFLALNDLENGRYFDENTLPAQLFQIPAAPATSSPSLPPLQRSTLLRNASSQPSPTQSSQAALARTSQHDAQPSTKQISNSSADSSSSMDELSANVPTTDRTAVFTADSAPRPKRSKSPQGSQSRHLTVETSQPGRNAPAGSSPHHLPSHRQKAAPPRTEEPSSPSSTAGPRSTNTSREDAHSPVTSPDEDATERTSHQFYNSGTSGQRGSHGHATYPVQSADIPSPESRRDSAFETRRNDGSQNLDPGPLKALTALPQSGNGRQPPSSSQVITPAPSGNDENSPRTTPVRGADSMDIDQSFQDSENALLERSRPRKRKLSSSSRRVSLVVSKLEKQTQRAQHLPPHRLGDSKTRDPKEDYMYLLFHKEAHDKAYKHDLMSLLSGSNKSLSTSEWLAGHREKQDCAIIKRVYDLQQRGMWSLRQPKPAQEPKHELTHQDHLLRHIKWLQTDFREERKFKVDTAYQVACWCAEYVNASPEVRLSLRVRAKAPALAATDDAARDQNGLDDETEHPLFHGDFLDKLPFFHMDDPVRQASTRLHVRSGSDYGTKLFPPASEPNLPTEYDLDPDAVLDDDKAAAKELEPEASTCALFDPAHKTLRARVNVQWPFKPPTGPHASMPPQHFYENRHASQWTAEDDAQLRGYVKDFPSNWDLISDRMAPRTKFPSTRDRRTPWECFERLINMEGPPQDPSSKPYVRYFMSRLESARARFTAAQAASIQQAQQTHNGNQQLPQAQRFATPIKVERRASNRRFLGLLDGARKLARRRENAAVKSQQQQQAAENSAQAATQKPPRTHPPHNPAQLSKIKYEQQVALQKRHEQQRQQIKVLQAQQQQQARQSGNQPLSMGISQRIGNGAPTTASGHLAVPGQAQSRTIPQQQSSQVSLPTGARPNSQLAQMTAANARPQMNGQPGAQGGQQMMSSVNNNEQSMHQLLAQQGRNLQQMQQTNQFSRGSSNTANGVSNSNNQALLGGFSGNNMVQTNGAVPSPGNSQVTPNSTQSPSMASSQMRATNGNNQHRRTSSQGVSLSSGTIPQIYSTLADQIRRTNPNMSQEEALHMAKNQLMQQSRQNALNAASGVHSNISTSSQGNGQMQMPPPGPGSPYQQQSGMQANYNGTNGAMLNANAMQGRSGSPINPQIQQQSQAHTQQQYQQHLRQQMYAQSMGQMMTGGTMGSPNTATASPVLNTAQVSAAFSNGVQRSNAGGVNPNQGMRPPSRSANSMAMNLPNGGSFDHQRAGSSGQMSTPQMTNAQMATPRLASQSPRPLSAQGAQQ